MLKYSWFFLAALLAGVFGGMGMGGGTILMPLAGLFFSPDPLTLRTANLAGFVPMACVALGIHLKNGLVERRGLLKMLFAVTGASFFTAIFSIGVDGELIKKIFGGFLITLSVFQFFFGDEQSALRKRLFFRHKR